MMAAFGQPSALASGAFELSCRAVPTLYPQTSRVNARPEASAQWHLFQVGTGFAPGF